MTDPAIQDETIIAIAVVERAGHYLIGPRPADRPLAGYWEFPGGKVREGEPLESAAIRECREETGIDVRVVRALDCQSYDYPHGRVRLHFFLCEPHDSVADREPRAPFRWMAAASLAEYPFPPANQCVLTQLFGERK